MPTFTAEDKAKIMAEARQRLDGTWKPEVVVKRLQEPALLHRTRENARVTPIEPVQSAAYDDAWNDWLSRGITTRFEAERELTLDAVGEALGMAQKQLRDEFAGKTRVLSEQVKALKAEAASLRTALAEQRIVVGLYKELGSQRLELERLRTEVRDFIKEFTPLLKSFRGEG